MPDKLKFNKEQEKAITYGNGPVLIVAGAGTGKTMVITQRISHLILDKGIKTAVYDRSGYEFHGIIKAVADAAREAGLDF